MKKKTIAAVIGSCLLAAGVAACGVELAELHDRLEQPGPIIGAGSTLIAPLMSTWSTEYEKKTKVTVTYGPIGSGGGIAQITARTVDFGASDAPLTPDQFKEAKGVVQIPWALAATAIAYHLEGAPNKLKLTGPVLAEIYEGKITTWNDSKIAALNPGVSLPATKIVPVHRTDGSGDTYAFTNYLSHVSPEWSSKIGKGTEVAFPGGIGGKGNSGVGGAISSTNGVDRVHRHRVRDREQVRLLLDPERGGRIPRTQRREHLGGRQIARVGARGTTKSRSLTRRLRRRAPTRSRPSPIRSSRKRLRRRASRSHS